MDSTPPAPTGRVTVVYTDVAGSAALWERYPDAMREALELHDALLRETVEASGGREARVFGTAFVLVWTDAIAAVRWCLRFQEALLDCPWPEPLLEHPEAAGVRDAEGRLLWRGLRVRMGVHSAEPVPGSEAALRGPTLGRAGRLAHVARGGQVLLSEVAWREVAALEGEARLEDLGAHRLRGVGGLVRLVDARAPALAGREVGRLPTMEHARTNVLPDLNALVGRDGDLSALTELFGLGVRLVLVVGGPGLGKSRLVREFARRNLGRWSGEDQGGAWVCDLSESRELADLLQSVGSALDVPLTLGRVPGDSVAQIGHALASRGPILLALDELDRLGAEGQEAVLSWMRAAPTLRVLATATRRLPMEREVAYRLDPLGVLVDDHPAEAAAVRLLTRRLREGGEGVRLSADQQRACSGLLDLAGGLPLAVEMLAGQVGVHLVSDLEADVAGRLEDADAASAEQRLGAVFDACLARLRPWERGALARCSVFRGGFDLPAAEAVIDLSEWAGAPSVGDAVERLRELGLLRTTEVPAAPGTRRYWMHPFVREAVSGSFPPPDRAATVERHAAYFVQWGEPWAIEVHRVEGNEALARLDEERHNLLSAVRGVLALRPRTAARVDLALRGARILCRVLAAQGPFELELQLLDAVIDASAQVEGASAPRLAALLRERGDARRVRGQWARHGPTSSGRSPWRASTATRRGRRRRSPPSGSSCGCSASPTRPLRCSIRHATLPAPRACDAKRP